MAQTILIADDSFFMRTKLKDIFIAAGPRKLLKMLNTALYGLLSIIISPIFKGYSHTDSL